MTIAISGGAVSGVIMIVFCWHFFRVLFKWVDRLAILGIGKSIIEGSAKEIMKKAKNAMGGLEDGA